MFCFKKKIDKKQDGVMQIIVIEMFCWFRAGILQGFC
jgi:hypothetical protein